MRNKIQTAAVPCSLLFSLALLHLLHGHGVWTLGLAAIPPLAAALSDTPPALPRLPVCLLILVLLGPPELRHALLAIPATATLVVLVTALSIVTLAASFAGTIAGCTIPRWSRSFAIQSDTVAALAHTELRLIWFALMRWRRLPSDRPRGAVAFEANKTGTDVAMAWVAAASGLIEGPLLHVLLRHVSPTTAWLTTGLTIVASIYFIGFAKSLALRPTLLFHDKLVIRLGAVASRSLPRSEINQVRLLQGPTPRKGIVRLFAFDKPNIAVSAKGKNYLFRVDHPKSLLAELQAT